MTFSTRTNKGINFETSHVTERYGFSHDAQLAVSSWSIADGVWVVSLAQVYIENGREKFNVLSETRVTKNYMLHFVRTIVLTDWMKANGYANVSGWPSSFRLFTIVDGERLNR